MRFKQVNLHFSMITLLTSNLHFSHMSHICTLARHYSGSPLRLGAVHPAPDVGRLARLKLLIDVEEVPDLVEQVTRHVGQVPDTALADVVSGNAEQLGVRAALVVKPEHRDRAHCDQAAGKG